MYIPENRHFKHLKNDSTVLTKYNTNSNLNWHIPACLFSKMEIIIYDSNFMSKYCKIFPYTNICYYWNYLLFT